VRHIRASLCLALLTAALGCAGGSAVPVEGQLTVAGKPPGNATVTFVPDPTKGNTAPFPHFPLGTTDAQGRYRLSTAGVTGAPPGWYKVMVRATAPADPKRPYAVPRSIIDKASSSPETTRLSVEVKADAPAGSYDLKLAK
jgi:hypothetical protein